MSKKKKYSDEQFETDRKQVMQLMEELKFEYVGTHKPNFCITFIDRVLGIRLDYFLSAGTLNIQNANKEKNTVRNLPVSGLKKFMESIYNFV